jgi:hypothetical protein
MMANLKPLTEGEATELEARLLVAGQEQRLPETARQAIWSGIAAGLPAKAVAQVGASTVASAPGAGLVKAIVAVVVVGGSVVAGHRVLRPAESTSAPGQSGQVARPGASVAPTVEASELDERPTQLGSSRVERAAEPRGPAAQPATSPATSQLGEESLAVLGIRQALRSGNYGLALGLLEQARGRFPRGALGQEREALMIEALAQSGARAAAEKRALAFLRAYPKSPYAVDVQRYTGR